MRLASALITSMSSMDGLDFGLLGTVSVRHDGATVPIRSPMSRNVFAALLLNANRVVSAERLVEVLWGDEPPASAIASLHNHLQRLRALLGADGRARIRTVPPGYLIQVNDGELDLDLFTGLARCGREAHQVGDWDAAARDLGAALGLWRGDPLADVTSVALREAEVPRLRELRLETVEAQIAVDLQLGRAAEVVAVLGGLTTEYPLRERLRAQLMLAYYRTGRQVEALAVYQAARDVLVGELGVEPGHELKQLQRRILAADPGLELPSGVSGEPPVMAGRLPARSPVVRPMQLPSDLCDFTGRQDQVKVLVELLAAPERRSGAVVVSSVTGTAGIGKTSLVIRAAHEVRDLYPDGQLWFSMRSVGARPAEPAEVLARFLRDLGEDPAGIPAEEGERAARFRSVAADRQLLIVLDDVRDAAQVRSLLPGTSGCAVLVTSRSPLADLPGARPVLLDALPKDQALELLTKIIGVARIIAEPDAADAVVELCAGLPLALRIAGARLAARPHWRVRDLADRVSDAAARLNELVVGDLSVRASFAVSYGNLPIATGGDVDPARAFRLLGLWSGMDISLPAAAALFGVTDQVAERVLETLLDSHLLSASSPARRYRLHDLLRVYAAERAHDEETPVGRYDAVRRLTTWYLHTADAAAHVLEPRIQRVPLTSGDSPVRPLDFGTYDEALRWCEAERASLVTAVHLAADYGLHAHAWQLPATLRRFFRLGKYWTEWIATFQIALASARTLGDRRGEGWILGSLFEPYTDLRRLDEAIGYLNDALAIQREVGDRHAEARTLTNLGVNFGMLGRFEESADFLRQALAIHREEGARYNEAIALENLGDTRRGLGKYDDAIDYLRQALAIHREEGARYNEASTLATLGDVFQDLQLHEKAIEYYEQALTIRCSLGDRGGEANTLIGLSQALLKLNRTDEARESVSQAHSILTDIGDPRAVDLHAQFGEVIR
jgi:DNA-binding SARP family transcriptional activator/tetratricopeptide (TPR) repeat protein